MLCGSGSLALEIALRACGVREGDEVIVPTFCCTSVIPPIVAVGARPVLADVGEELNITAETVEAALTKKTRAIVVPHLFGNPAGIHAIIDLVRGKNIRVIDDAAQALGATIDGRPVGAFGDLGILSFGSEKVCFGLGGGVVVSRQKENLKGGWNLNLSPAQLSPTLAQFSFHALLAPLAALDTPGPDLVVSSDYAAIPIRRRVRIGRKICLTSTPWSLQVFYKPWTKTSPRAGRG